jgi:integrase
MKGSRRCGMDYSPHVFVRPGELRLAEWKEFDFDQRVWLIPHRALGDRSSS